MNDAAVEVVTDLAEACEVLSDAFSVDRAVHEILRMDRGQLRRLYGCWVPTLLENPHSIVLGVRDGRGLASVAVCQGPGKDGSSLRMLWRGLPLLWNLGLRRCRLLMQMDRGFRRNSPLRPGHLRLAILGTRLDAWHRGYGSVLLKQVDAQAACSGFSRVYLEADSDGQPKLLYQRHGYETVQRFESLAGPIDIMVKSLVRGNG